MSKRGKKATPRMRSAREQGSKADREREKARQEALRRSVWELKDSEIERLLDTDERKDELREMFGSEAYEELRSLKRASSRRDTLQSAKRGGDVVWILPGIMGSKLGRVRKYFFDDVLWIDPIDITIGKLRKLADLGATSSVVPLGAFDMAYFFLKMHLRLDGFEVRYWPYDWRKSLRDSGKRLRDDILKSPRPVHLVCHSMGGLVAREALRYPELTKAKLRRVIQLATPNRGSFAPALALTGDHDVVEAVSFLDGVDNGRELIDNVFSFFPGLYELLPDPSVVGEVALWERESWPKTYRPKQPMLDAARRAISEIPPPDDRFVLIAGVDHPTVVSGKLTEKADAFEWSTSTDGDGTVPLDFARMPGLSTWYVEAEHGSIANKPSVARAVADLLKYDETTELSQQRGVRSPALGKVRRVPRFAGRRGVAVSGGERRMVLAPFVSPPQPSDLRASTLSGISVDSSIAAKTSANSPMKGVVVGRRRQHRLDLLLANASITEVKSRAYVIGAFQGVQPRGAAVAIDEQLEGAISEFTMRRMFSATVGEVFTIPAGRSSLTADYVVVTGLGGFDSFDGGVQEQVAENVIRAMVKTHIEDFATVLLGTASGAAVKATLERMIHGFVRGLLDSDGNHQFRRVTLCENDPERYQELRDALWSLSRQPLLDEIELTISEVQCPARLQEVRESRGGEKAGSEPIYLHVESVLGRKNPSDVDPRTLRVRTEPAERGKVTYRVSLLDTVAKASILVRNITIKTKELDAAIKKFAVPGVANAEWTSCGEELGALVIPEEIRRALREAIRESENRELVIIHDAAASKIPWEGVVVAGKTLGLSLKLSRRYMAPDLSIAKYLEKRRDDATLDILLIADASGTLVGAAQEVKDLEALRNQIPGCRITIRSGPEVTRERLIEDFNNGKFDVVHYSGHAFFDSERPERSGILCADEQVLTGSDIAQLVHAPSLVFFNACESARVRKGSAAKEATKKTKRKKGPKQQVGAQLERTVSFAEAFLRGGVCQFVGTYWPVEDDAAKDFALAFYRVLADGQTTGFAIDQGRDILSKKKRRDFANYVHFGSREFRVKRQPSIEPPTRKRRVRGEGE